MTVKPWMVGVLAAGLLGVWGVSCHIKSVSRLEGEIKARGESIQQLGQLAARKQPVYEKAHKAYTLKPSLETCAPALSACAEIHQTDSLRNVLLTKQVADYKKLKKQEKIFGILPRPHVQVGYCLGADGKAQPCLSGGFNIF